MPGLDSYDRHGSVWKTARKCNRSSAKGQQQLRRLNKSWKSLSGEPLSAIATSFWKIERAVWSSWNIPFTVLTSFNLKVVIAERVAMERQKKKIWWTSQQGTEQNIFRVIFRIRFKVITTMIVQITTFIADFFKIQSSDSPTPTHGEPEKKICWTSQQGTTHSIFGVIFRIRFEDI